MFQLARTGYQRLAPLSLMKLIQTVGSLIETRTGPYEFTAEFSAEYPIALAMKGEQQPIGG